MALYIEALSAAGEAAWDAFVASHECGSPFHLTAWKKSIEQTFGFRPHYLLARDGGQLAAVLPLFLVKNPLTGKVLISTPFAVYGGILAVSDEARQALANEAAELGRRLQVQYVELRNAYPSQRAGFEPLVRYVTFLQQIGPDAEAILNAIPRKTRYMVRKALRHPYTLEPVADWRVFEDLYTANLQRLGTPAFPSRHFENLRKNFGSQADVREVRLEGKPVAAVMSFYFRDRILPYYGASDPEFNEYAPNNYMYYELMRQAGEAGYRVFDFGRSKKESGSFDFKAHWGMEVVDLPYEILLVKRATLPNFTPNNPRYQPFIKLWQRLPLPVTRAVGPWLLKLVP